MSDQQLNELTSALGNNHVNCFEAMEIRKYLQEMWYNRLNSSTVVRPKYGALTYRTIARMCVKPKFTLHVAKKNLNYLT